MADVDKTDVTGKEQKSYSFDVDAGYFFRQALDLYLVLLH